MMKLSQRMKQILQVLLNETKPISVQSLAEEIGVSKRTVQRELEYVASDLDPYHIRFASKTGVGVWLEGSAENKLRLKSRLEEDFGFDAFNREERRKRLILEVLKEKGLKKLFSYSSQFGVSEATISADLEGIEEWLERFRLCIVRKPGSGVSIEGAEQDYRRAIRAFIRENMDTQAVRDAYLDGGEGVRSYERLKQSSLGTLLDDDVMRGVINCLTRTESDRIANMTENSYLGLVIHVSIAIERILKNETLTEEESWEESLVGDEDYALACQIVNRLERSFGVSIPETEASYICLHIKGSKHETIRWRTAGEREEDPERRMQLLVNRLVDAFDREKAYGLKQDEGFIQGLLAHLHPTLVRLTHCMQIQNPVLEDIKSSYPEIFERCRAVAAVLEEETGRPVPEEEIGYLTVHFGAGLESLEERTGKLRRVRVGVVCSSGIGISRLMSSKLERVFRDRITVTAYGKKDITPYICSKVDFFVSSLALDRTEKEVLYVNPLLNEEDMDRIQKLLLFHERQPAEEPEADRFMTQLEEINRMADQINKIIKYMDFFKVDNHISFDELLIAVAERMSPYSDRRERIREDIERRERIASQIFAEFDFALLHASTRGVIRPGFGVCVTKDRGAFEDPYFKNIHLVYIMLAPEDENTQAGRDIFGYISTMIIEDVEFLEACMKGERERIRSLLSGRMKAYFQSRIGTI